jgi:hypothetical protein
MNLWECSAAAQSSTTQQMKENGSHTVSATQLLPLPVALQLARLQPLLQ